MAKLIAQMIGRNEADRFLPEVLDHLKTIADVIVFTDDCSTDNTLEIAKEKGCEGFASIWDEPHFPINEGEQRMQAWKNLETIAEWGDWILAIDADEKLFVPYPNLRSFFDHDIDVMGVAFFHMWNETHFRVDKAWRPNLSSRLFRYFPNGTFNNRKLACGSEPTYVQDSIRMGKVLWQSELRMQHLGYVKDEDKKLKYDRYMKLDGGDFHAKAHIESIIDPNPTLELWRQDG